MAKTFNFYLPDLAINGIVSDDVIMKKTNH